MAFPARFAGVSGIIAKTPSWKDASLGGHTEDGYLDLAALRRYRHEEHMLVGGLRRLFELERGALAKVAEGFKEELGDNLLSMIIFGSVARGEERPDSDIDMILALKDGSRAIVETKMASISNASAAASGSPVSPVLATGTELERMQAKKDKRGMWAEVFGEEPVIFIDFDRNNPRLRHIEAGKYLTSPEIKHNQRARRK